MFGFSFLNPAFIYGLAAISLPILIHLLFKAKTRRVVFSSIQFIMASVVRKRRRLRLKEWLLLLLRAAIVACIVLAFARPFLKKGQAARYGQIRGKDVLLLIDDTCSMRFKKDGKIFFQRAIDAARATVGELRRGQRVAILSFTGSQQTEGFLPDRKTAINALEQMNATSFAAQASDALIRADELIRTQCAAPPCIFIFSDFQKTTWTGVVRASLAARFIPGAQIDIVDVGAPNLSNIAITGIPVAITVSGGTQVFVRVQNFGKQPREKLPLRAIIDGKTVSEQMIDLASDSAREFLFTLPARLSGVPFAFEIEAEEDFQIDNTRFGVLHRTEPLRALLVEETPPAEPFRRTGFFLSAALNPWKNADRASQPIIAQIVATDALTPEAIAQADVLALTDAGMLSNETLKEIVAAVRNGCGVILFGSEIFPARAWKAFFSDANTPRPIVRRGIEGETWRIDAIDKPSPLFENLPPGFIDQLKSVVFRGYLSVTAPKDASVVAWFASGDPAIITRKIGRGKAIFFTSSADNKWTDFPKRACYVPFMHAFVSWVARAKPRLAIKSALTGTMIPRKRLEDAKTIVTPRGKTSPADDAKAIALLSPGFYALITDNGKTTWIAANIDRRESDPTRLAYAEIKRLARGDDTVRKIEEDADLVALRRQQSAAPPGSERFLFLLALVLMVVELAIANRMRV